MKTGLHREEVQDILKKGKRALGGEITLVYSAKKEKKPRFAVIVSKKVARKATVRNKIRRLVREVLQKSVPVKSNFAIIVNKGKKHTLESIEKSIKETRQEA